MIASCKSILISLIAIIMYSGCSSKQDLTVAHHQIDITRPKPYQFTLKPTIGSESDDARTVVDMGVVLKIWIKNYKNKEGSLVASHDVYAWARKPDFIVGETLPARHRTGLPSPAMKLPFMLTGEELSGSDLQDDEAIKSYVNKVYEAENDPEIARKRLEESRKSDHEILKFLKQVKGER